MADRTLVQQIEDDAALYTLGALSREDAARLEKRLASDCALCQAEVRACEITVAALAASTTPVAPPAALRQRLVDRISDEIKGPASEESVMEIVRADGGFVQTPMPGVQIRYLKGKNTFLVRMAPKSNLPAHEHKHNEQCLILEGSISGDGQT